MYRGLITYTIRAVVIESEGARAFDVVDVVGVVEVVVEVSRFGFIKRKPHGEVDFVSPVPCPVNYGSIPSRIAPDGDPLDAVVLGPRLRRGQRVEVPVRAVIGFLDAGLDDRKVICSHQELSAKDRLGLLAFFHVYALSKRALNRARGRRGETRCLGFVQ